MFKFLKLKKAAMFGIDARITLAVTAIAAFVVGVNQFADIDRNNIDDAALDLRQIKNSTLQYYEEKYVMVSDIATLITDHYLDLAQEINSDPWGNPYVITSIAQDETVGSAVMNTKYVTLISLGKDGVQDTVNPTDYSTWQTTAAANDDVILKFDTRAREEKVAEAEKIQLEIVKHLINNYVSTKKQELASFCDILGNQLNANCDIDSNGTYEEDEESELNFMLREIDDSDGEYYLTNHTTHGTTAQFKSGYINTSSNTEYNMYSFISQLGGTDNLVTSPRGLVLHFDSNKYNNTEFPYFSEIWYDTETTVF